jgi:hypothetical protein
VPKPPSPADHYPLRTYEVTLQELLGAPASEVLAHLGRRDGTGTGTVWPPLPKDDGALTFTKLVLTPSGTIIEARPFGVYPKTIIYPTAYETWTYHNVRGLTWVLFMTHNGACYEPSGGADMEMKSCRKSLWERLTSLFRSRSGASLPENSKLPPPPRHRPREPLAVAEVNYYSTGAVF